MKTKEKIEEKILKLLKKKELSTSKIAQKIKRNYNKTLELLKNLKKEKKISSNETIKGVYWELK